MIHKLKVLRGEGFDPHYNLAVEQVLLESVGEGECIFYLWRNENTVVIGRNQNAWRECRSSLLQEEGGRLARRLSGGGAVFHDLGNLNFTFLMRQTDYDLDKQLSVIEMALRALGVEASRSGRNDILAEGRKVSGNAFYKNGTQAYHHGTLLVDADMEKLSRYLSPSKAKLEAKGVASVRSRVANLKELNSSITVDILMDALEESFSEVYGLKAERITEDSLDSAAIEILRLRNCSWDWLWGRKLSFDYQAEDRFPWGSLELRFRVENGIITRAQVHSDAMDWALAPKLEEAFIGCPFDQLSLLRRVEGLPWEADVAKMLIRLEI